MPFLNGEVGGISKHVPAVQKERVVRVLVSNIFFGVPHLFFIHGLRRFVSLFRASGENDVCDVCMYMYIYIHTCLLVRVYTYMSLDPSGEGVKLISTMVLYKFGRHFPFPGGWAAFGLDFCYPLAL